MVKKAFMAVIAIFLIVSVVLMGVRTIKLVQAATSESSALTLVPSMIWNQTYSDTGLHAVNSVIETADGGFMLGAMAGVAEGNRIELVKVNSSGWLQWNKVYRGTTGLFGRCLVQTSDGGYAVAGQYGGGCWLGKLDEDGNVQWNRTYIGAGVGGASALVQTSDGGYAVAGGSSTVWLMKTDATGNEQWNKTLGAGNVISLIQTSDEGYVIVGCLGSNMPDYLLTKANSTGDLQWTRTYGSADKDIAYSIVQTSDGGYAVGGWMWLRSNGGGHNLAIVKTDASGAAQWTKYYGGGMGWTLTGTSDGGFAIAGTAIVKVDSLGNEEWSLSFQYPDVNQTGAVYQNQAYVVTQTKDGGYAVAGMSVFYGGQGAAWLAKVKPVTGPQSTAKPSSTPVPTLSPTQTQAPLTASLSESASALNFGNRVNFTVSVEGGKAPYTYAWYVDNQLAETGSSPFYGTDSMAVGSHHVYVEVTDLDNSSATTLTVEFNVLPASSFSPSPTIPEFPTATLAIATLLATATFAVCIRRRKR